VAVAVEGDRHIVLDEEYRIVEVGASAAPEFGAFLGRRVWDVFPDSRAVFLPHLEEAHRTGEPVEFVQFFEGTLVRVDAVPENRRLAISRKVLGTVDVSTLESLRNSLLGIVNALADEETAPYGTSLPPLLRLLEGGAAGPRDADQDSRDAERDVGLDRA
jgi:hypothetical protein